MVWSFWALSGAYARECCPEYGTVGLPAGTVDLERVFLVDDYLGPLGGYDYTQIACILARFVELSRSLRPRGVRVFSLIIQKSSLSSRILRFSAVVISWCCFTCSISMNRAWWL